MKTKLRLIMIFLLMSMLISACATANVDNNEEEVSSSNNIEINIIDGYVEFGSYPQREVVANPSDSGVNNKKWESDDDYIIDEDLYSTLSSLTDDKWDEHNDTEIDGNMYRRIKASDATYSTTNDINYYDWSSTTTYHYFKYEPIKWIVLEENEDEIFVLSSLAIDDQMYNTKISGITWETSTIRSWLNGYDENTNDYGTDYTDNNFIDIAFSDQEKLLIKETARQNNDNIKNGTEGGNDTTDKIFLLGENDVYGDIATNYGFNSEHNADDLNRQVKSTTYGKAMGTYVECEDNCLGNSFWWLSTPGSHPGLFILVRCDGSVYRGGQHADSKSRGVRPALCLSLQTN